MQICIPAHVCPWPGSRLRNFRWKLFLPYNAGLTFIQFPSASMIILSKDMGLDLVTMLDKLKIQTVVAMGDGAGANIVMQFAISYPNRVWGVVLINCSAAEGPDSVDRGTLLVS